MSRASRGTRTVIVQCRSGPADICATIACIIADGDIPWAVAEGRIFRIINSHIKATIGCVISSRITTGIGDGGGTYGEEIAGIMSRASRSTWTVIIQCRSGPAKVSATIACIIADGDIPWAIAEGGIFRIINSHIKAKIGCDISSRIATGIVDGGGTQGEEIA